VIKYFLDKPMVEGLDLRFERGSDGASGYDLMANCSSDRTINPGERLFVRTGLYLEMPAGVEAQSRSRSGLSLNHGVIVLNAPGTIDSDYRGEVGVTLYNAGVRHSRGVDGTLVEGLPFVVHPGARIAQLVFCPIMDLFAYYNSHKDSALTPHFWKPQRVESRKMLSDSGRGESGHGSTGI